MLAPFGPPLPRRARAPARGRLGSAAPRSRPTPRRVPRSPLRRHRRRALNRAPASRADPRRAGLARRAVRRAQLPMGVELRVDGCGSLAQRSLASSGPGHRDDAEERTAEQDGGVRLRPSYVRRIASSAAMRSATAPAPSKANADSSAGPNCRTEACRAMRSVVGSSTSGAGHGRLKARPIRSGCYRVVQVAAAPLGFQHSASRHREDPQVRLHPAHGGSGALVRLAPLSSCRHVRVRCRAMRPRPRRRSEGSRSVVSTSRTAANSPPSRSAMRQMRAWGEPAE